MNSDEHKTAGWLLGPPGLAVSSCRLENRPVFLIFWSQARQQAGWRDVKHHHHRHTWWGRSELFFLRGFFHRFLRDLFRRCFFGRCFFGYLFSGCFFGGCFFGGFLGCRFCCGFFGRCFFHCFFGYGFFGRCFLSRCFLCRFFSGFLCCFFCSHGACMVGVRFRCLVSHPATVCRGDCGDEVLSEASSKVAGNFVSGNRAAQENRIDGTRYP